MSETDETERNSRWTRRDVLAAGVGGGIVASAVGGTGHEPSLIDGGFGAGGGPHGDRVLHIHAGDIVEADDAARTWEAARFDGGGFLRIHADERLRFGGNQ